MKNPRKLCAIFCVALLLAGCASSDDNTALSTSASSDGTPQASANIPATSAPSEPSQSGLSAFDAEAFKLYIVKSNYGIFMGRPFAPGSSIQSDEHSWGANGIITHTLHNYIGKKSDHIKDFYLPVSKAEIVATEIFGQKYGYVGTREILGEEIPADSEPFVPLVDGFGPTYQGEMKPETLAYKDGIITYEMDFSSGYTGERWGLAFTMEYHPEATYCPYRLVQSELIYEFTTLEPDTQVQPSVTYITTANLNLRYGPGTEYEVINLLSEGEEVHYAGYMLDGPKDWIYVHTTLPSGWVNTAYLRPK